MKLCFRKDCGGQPSETRRESSLTFHLTQILRNLTENVYKELGLENIFERVHFSELKIEIILREIAQKMSKKFLEGLEHFKRNL